MRDPDLFHVNGINYPALSTYYKHDSTKGFETVMAASASGNGIADSFLWRLPIGTIDGVTYYAAVRIIDNNSAINVNTANSSYRRFRLQRHQRHELRQCRLYSRRLSVQHRAGRNDLVHSV